MRLWDHQPLLDTFGQLQEIRTYYDFVGVDNDRYRIDGALRQIMLSPRELNTASLPNRTWVNERLTFTHGYGLTLGPVNQVTEEGLPVLFVGNLPLETIPELPIEEPSLYFGELSNDYVIVRTQHARVSLSRAARTTCSASTTAAAACPSDRSWRKLIFALRFGAYQIAAEQRHHAPTAGSCSSATSASASRSLRRSCRSTATRTSWSPTAGCSGCTTPTRPARAIPYSTPAGAAASTTSATR